MGVYLGRIFELAGKVESTKGTFNAPAVDGTESKFLVKNAQLFADFEAHDRNVMTTDMSKFPAVIGKTPMRMTFDLEMRRTATAASEDQWNNLMRICGFVGTNPASNLVLKPSSKHSDHSCMSFYVYVGSTGTASMRYAMKGCAGTVRGVHQNGETSLLSFEIWGVYNGFSTAGAVNSVTHEATKPSAFLAPTLTLDSFAAKVARFAWDVGNEVVAREDVNAAEGILHFLIVNRNVTFETDPEFEATGTKDWNGMFLAGTEFAVAFNIQGANLTFSAPKALIKSMGIGERNGIRVAELTGDLNRSSGDDEIVITKA